MSPVLVIVPVPSPAAIPVAFASAVMVAMPAKISTPLSCTIQALCIGGCIHHQTIRIGDCIVRLAAINAGTAVALACRRSVQVSEIRVDIEILCTRLGVSPHVHRTGIGNLIFTIPARRCLSL